MQLKTDKGLCWTGIHTIIREFSDGPRGPQHRLNGGKNLFGGNIGHTLEVAFRTFVSTDMGTGTAIERRILYYHRFRAVRSEAEFLHRGTEDGNDLPLFCSGEVHQSAVVRHHNIAEFHRRRSFEQREFTGKVRHRSFGDPSPDLLLNKIAILSFLFPAE